MAKDRQERRAHGRLGARRLQFRMLLNDVGHDFVQVHWLKFQFAAAEATVGQDILDERIHARAASNDALEVVSGLRSEVFTVILEHDLRVTFHSASGSAQIMGDGVGELLDLGDGLAQRGGSLLDALFQIIIHPGQLLFRVSNGFLGLPALGDVARDFGCANDSPTVVLDR